MLSFLLFSVSQLTLNLEFRSARNSASLDESTSESDDKGLRAKKEEKLKMKQSIHSNELGIPMALLGSRQQLSLVVKKNSLASTVK